MNIDGLGEKIVNQLVETGLLKTIDDIFVLKQQMLADLEGLGEKSAENLIQAIHESKQTTFARFVYALGIRNVGEHSAKLLEKHYKGSIKKFQQTTVEELETIDEIGPTIAQTVTQFWQDTNNRIMVQNCLNRGVSLAEIKRKMDQPLTGQIFVFTGSLEKFTRQEAKIMVEHLGGKTTDSVSKKTSYVVAGPGGGSKLKKAKELGSSIISENEFLEMLR